MSYRDQVVVITGGASGLGLKLGEAMAREGAKVVLADINESGLQATKRGFKEQNLVAEFMQVDVASHQSIKDLVTAVMERFGRIDVMMNNAGIGMIGSVCDVPLETWERMIDVNIKSVIYGIQEVYPIMIKQGSGQIVNTASLAGLIPMPGAVPYGMSKHAVVGLTLGLRAEAAAYGIKVNVLCPAFVKTNILKDSAAYNVGPHALKKVVANAGGAISLDEFITEAMAGIRANKSLIVLPKKARLAYRVFRFLPKKFFRANEKFGRGVRRMRGAETAH
ncbi:SDR family NAD(P)-dependent oxidoreductase [Pseudobacteriovorax antillogorgiicola]|uniref:Short-chain dehydrogenase n=1 Tax=Pseudobacteriovorax antillogorgiicola TaxID=1513793 RepID=A0A1Y6CEN8_9BACT|nr:SDR family oxidoreductase [Pseudobacteriovorax antillogorgiicola]TCS47679.1 short-subunit dehydrogenase [Pseudobacteriovorax antillogorgiicola]SMF59589.1 Short-chain dehydrogenase [Pseudobacteriovorax antillogorgiicola]